PISFSTKDSKVIEHAELPVVTDELSVTLRQNLLNKNPNWTSVFHKGFNDIDRTPLIWLTPNYYSVPHVRFSLNDNPNTGIDSVGRGLSLNQWYHLAYTLSEPQKRLDFYIDGKWIGLQSIQQVQKQQILFNNAPLYIGTAPFRDGFTGQISNFRYYNWSLSADEVMSTNTNASTIPTPTATCMLTSNGKGNINDIALIAIIGVGAFLL
ncbi:7738_t:CDS:2, partial [Ambispora leptoticha]